MEKKLKSVTSSGSGVNIDPLPSSLLTNGNVADKETIKSLNATIDSHVASIKVCAYLSHRYPHNVSGSQALTEAKAKSDDELNTLRSKSTDHGHSVVELSFKLSQTESQV